MAARPRKRKVREWTKQDERELRAHSKSKIPVVKIARSMRRTEGAVRQKARILGIRIGHRRGKKTR
jgi:hypothetical protein